MLYFDVETTTRNKGNPFDHNNILVCVGWFLNGQSGIWYYDQPIEILREVFKEKEWCAFNAKFDLHWMRRLGIALPEKVWCCQLAEFLINRQSNAYPSLEDTCNSYGIEGKYDQVKKEYWDKGIDTIEIPREILTPYCLQDVKILHNLRTLQLQKIDANRMNFFSLHMQDLLTLEDIEWNGLHFNDELLEEEKQKLDNRIAELQRKLDLLHSVPNFNWSSPAHLSALLYGGKVKEDRRVPVGVYKSGKRVGQPRYEIERLEHTLPRMYAPPAGSETATEGVWSTDEETLKKIKGGKKELISTLLELREVQKLQSTYVGGLLQKHNELGWEPNYLHGQYNQVVARTGRLSSKVPNMQNFPDTISHVLTTRYQ
jgi:DNA polymerase I-like protein with 3'-5' exonuclease and polymerase domains